MRQRMTLEEYIKEQRERVANMTLAQARQIVANHYGHDDERIECEKAVKMLLNCADEKINGGWIPVTERLPKEEGFYLVTRRITDDVATFIFRRTLTSKDYWKRCVTAWMPLPKSYKAESEVEK